MSTLQLVTWLIQGSYLLTGLVLLVLQIRAFLRYRHRSFLLLALGSAAASMFLIAGLLMHAVAPGSSGSILLYAFSMFVLMPAQCILAIWGTLKLYKSYADLAEHARTGTNL
jgi:predicted neutral ceramidase superfamily lipid hydrolase